MNGREQPATWNEEIWNRIDMAVEQEGQRAEVASKFLPMHGPVPSGELTYPADTVITGQPLTIDENATVKFTELTVQFCLTEQQVQRERPGDLMTAVTLATRATNLLKQGKDIAIFQGQSAVERGETQHPLFKDEKVLLKSGDPGQGLVSSLSLPIQQIDIASLERGGAADANGPKRYGERTTAAVFDAYSRLQSGTDLNQAHYGPYAVVLHNEPYADTFAPLETTLIMSYDRICPLLREQLYGPGAASTGDEGAGGSMIGEMTSRFYGTGTLPASGKGKRRETTGFMVSLGGNTMDLVTGMAPRTEFVTKDTQGNYCFRVWERFAFRFKDVTAGIRLNFK